MNSIIEKIKKINIMEVVRYGMVTASSYVVLYVGTYLLVEKAGMSPQISYFILLTLIYVGVYISYTKFVFKDKFTKKTFGRFVIALVAIWIINNGFFYILNSIFELHYILTITLNIVIFGGLRFFFQRFYVFKSSYEQQP